MGLDGCTIHENCQQAYPCARCYDEDHPPPSCGHRFIEFLSSPSCPRHPLQWPKFQACPTCGMMIPILPIDSSQEHT